MGGSPWVLVVAETPSLARSIVDLLESDGHRVSTVEDPGRALTRRMKDADRPVRLVISASNGFSCATAGRWARAEILGIDLVVVGSRDPNLRSGARVHVVPLPLAPDEFLQLVRGLLDRAGVPSLHTRRGTFRVDDRVAAPHRPGNPPHGPIGRFAPSAPSLARFG